MMRLKILLMGFILVAQQPLLAQEEDLLSELDSLSPDKPKPVLATFKGNRIINGHSVEVPGKGEALFLISHRFGDMRNGAYTLFGIDQASVRFGLEYSPINNLCVGVGRSVYQKTVDGFLKYRVLQQTEGKGRVVPVSVVWFSSVGINGLKWTDPNIPYAFKHRLAYTHQILLARKFSSNFSLQIMPTLVHFNLVQSRQDANQIYAVGIGARYKVHKRVALSAEAYPMINRHQAQLVNGLEPQTSVALGVDIETGGHVFQLHITNTQAMVEKGFIAETPSEFPNGPLYFGFNISRAFSF